MSDQRALAAKKLAQKFLISANASNPVPRNYRPDETVTEDGSQKPRDRQGIIDPHGITRRLPNLLGAKFHPTAEETRAKYFKALATGGGKGFGQAGLVGIHPDRLLKMQPPGGKSGQLFSGQRRTFEEHPNHPPQKRMRKNGPRAPPQAAAKAKGKYYEPNWATRPATDYTICIFKGKEFLQKIDISQKSSYIIGRMTDCDILVNDQSVSRYHAVIQHGKGGVWIYDLGSTHRTFVNDHKPLVNDGLLQIHKYKRILMYDIIMFGKCQLFYRLEGGPTRPEFEKSQVVQ